MLRSNLDLSFLPEPARIFAESDRSLAVYWQQEKKKLPLPKNYIPLKAELRVNNELCLTIVTPENITDYTEEKLENLTMQSCIDLRLDNECVFLKAEGQVVIDRLSNKD